MKTLGAADLQPSRFDIRATAADTLDAPVIEPWRRIALDPDWAGAWIVAGDVDGCGQAEVVVARNVDAADIHYTCSVIVYRLDGSVLWRWGNPAAGRNKLHHDVAAQVYDWDGDGCLEVIVTTQDAIVELDGATGQEKRRIEIPADASDCIVFVNFSGGAHASDILIKDRYWRIWAMNRDGEVLWSVQEPAGHKTAHQPRVMDLDGDGRDEVMAGSAMLDGDGRVLWHLVECDLPLDDGHLDTIRVLEKGPTPADSRLVLTCCGGRCIAAIDGCGQPIWSITGEHFESIDVGKVCSDVPGPQIVVDIDKRAGEDSPTWLLSDAGDFLGRIVIDNSRSHLLVDWTGDGTEAIFPAQASAVFDGDGKCLATFEPPATVPGAQRMCYKGEISAPGAADLLLATNPGDEVCIYRNETGRWTDTDAPWVTGPNYTLY